MKKSLIIILVFVLGSSFIYISSYSPEILMGKKEPTLVGSNYNLQPKVAEAFEKMKTKASIDGISLYTASSYRGYDHQKRIWNNKWDRYSKQGLKGLDIAFKIIEYSTIPGTSRHHWGTDLDVVDLNVKVTGDKLLASNFEEGGPYEKLGRWLTNNASSYGFELVYTNKQTRKGFKYEPWHLTYKETSIIMYREYQKIKWFNNLTNDVKGKDFFTQEFIQKYTRENIQDINPILK